MWNIRQFGHNDFWRQLPTLAQSDFWRQLHTFDKSYFWQEFHTLNKRASYSWRQFHTLDYFVGMEWLSFDDSFTLWTVFLARSCESLLRSTFVMHWPAKIWFSPEASHKFAWFKALTLTCRLKLPARNKAEHEKSVKHSSIWTQRFLTTVAHFSTQRFLTTVAHFWQVLLLTRVSHFE